jgi:two-component system sensor histidine kinase UhpB
MNRHRRLNKSIMKKELRLLICEDVESDVAIIIRELEKTDFAVGFRCVETAEDMEAALNDQPWDIVISDFNIPGFGGEQALAVLYACNKDIPFILVSGTVGEETAVNMMKAGASDYLMKGNLARLTAAVKRELEEAAIRKAHRAGVEKIRANEAKYRAVIDQSSFAIFLARPGGLPLETNRAASVLFGYSAEEFKSVSREQLLDFSDGSAFEKIVERDSTGRSSGEFTAVKKNGERFFCEVSSMMFKDINGGDMTCAMISDITPRKTAEQQLKNYNKELKQLSRHLKNAREDERKYIAKEVHDQLGQLASALKIDVDWLTLKITDTGDLTNKRVDHINITIDTLLTSIRKIASSLRPSVLDDFGLNAAIEWQCADFQILNNIETVFVAKLNDNVISFDQKTELFRIAQESLTNVMRHSKATRVEVRLSENEENIYLTITDNGKGFDSSVKRRTLGLLGLMERAASLNGELHIESEIDKGTHVHVCIPKTTIL